MTNVSTYGRSLTQIDLLKTQQIQLSNLSMQLATGKITQKYSGLGNNVMISQRARSQFTSAEMYTNNIINAERRIDMMLDGVEQFQAQAENFAAALVGFTQESVHQKGEVIYWDDPLTTEIEQIPVGMTEGDPDADAKTLQEMAGNIYDILRNVLNTQDGDRYIYGGSETLTAPINDTGTLDSAISTSILNWKKGAIGTQSLISNLKDRSTTGNPDAITDTVIGYNAQLSSGSVGDVYVRVSDNIEVDQTLLANEQGLRDVMVSLSYFKSEGLWPVADVYAEPYTNGDPVLNDPDTGQPLNGAPGATLDEKKENFYEVFNNLTKMFNQALDDIDQLRYKLENARVQIVEAKESYQEQQKLMTDVISGVEDVNIDEVAVRLNMLEIQLDASYRVTARIQEISLVNFL